MRVTFVTSGLEHLGISALSAYVQQRGHEATLVYEAKPFSSNSGPDSPLLSRLLEPSPERTAEKIVATSPDVVAFSSYTITHRWSVEVARAVKRLRRVPIVFGGPHVSGAPAESIAEPAVDAVVEGEGEGALIDLLECAEGDRFGRSDVANTWFKGKLVPRKNAVRPLIQDLDELPYADKEIFYSRIPAFERELYIISRRGCPFRCSFCEYSIFPQQYPGEKAVRRRSVSHLLGELALYKKRGKMRKVFFWDAIFTLDVRWMEEFATRYRAEIGVPFECYTHPQAMTRDMARWLAHAGCHMVRVGVQTVNADTLAEMDRQGSKARVEQTVRSLRDHGLPYSLDHILGLPGEGPDDQRDAIRFYNEVRPARVISHWMTYLPGTTALARAEKDGILTRAQIERILRGEATEGYEAPRLVGAGASSEALDEIRRLSVLFDLMPLLPREAITWLLESGTYRHLPRGLGLQQAIAMLMAIVGDDATRERMRTILATAVTSVGQQARATS
ncbi:MAG: radical SAM protein [Minicystis sp.]